MGVGDEDDTQPVQPGAQPREFHVESAHARVGLGRSTIAEVINRLIRRGFLDRVRDPQDGRRFRLRPTDDGLRAHRKRTVRTARMNQVFPAPLSAAERTLFFSLIQRVTDAADELRAPADDLVAHP